MIQNEGKKDTSWPEKFKPPTHTSHCVTGAITQRFIQTIIQTMWLHSQTCTVQGLKNTQKMASSIHYANQTLFQNYLKRLFIRE